MGRSSVIEHQTRDRSKWVIFWPDSIKYPALVIVVCQKPDLNALPWCLFLRSQRVVKRTMWGTFAQSNVSRTLGITQRALTRKCIRIGVRLQEDQGFTRFLAGQIIPSKLLVEIYLKVLGSKIRIQQVSSFEVPCCIDTGGIAQRQRPVVQRSLQRFPHAD
jgi:hypothetical protein